MCIVYRHAYWRPSTILYLAALYCGAFSVLIALAPISQAQVSDVPSFSGGESFSGSGQGDVCSLPANVDEEALVRLALECSPRQQSIKAEWRMQEQRAQGAGSLDDPRFSIAFAPQTFDSDQVGTGYIAEFSQSVPWPGVLDLRARSAAAQADMWQTRIDQHALDLSRTVRLNYAQWQYHRQLLKLNLRHQNLWQENIAITQAKYASGYGSKSVLLQARQEFQQLRREALELKAEIQRDESQLRSLLNLPANAHLHTNQVLANELVDIPRPVIQQLLEKLDEQPVLQALTAENRHNDYELALAEKDRYPNFTFLTRYNRLRLNRDQRWLVGFAVNLPFDFGGKRSRHAGSLRARQEALRWERQQTRLELREGLLRFHSFWQQAKDESQIYQEDLLPLAEESLITARDEYQSGSSDFLAFLNAQHQAVDTQRQAEKAIRDQFVQQANLTAGAGFLWLSQWDSLNGNTANAAGAQ